MKKLLITCMMAFSAMMAFAQLGDISFTMNESYNKGEAISVSNVSFTPDDPSTVISCHTWEIIPCDENGDPTGDAVFSETLAGEPSTEYTFPVTVELPPGSNYKAALILLDVWGLSDDYFRGFYLEDIHMIAPAFICCNSTGTVSPYKYGNTTVLSWTWELYKSDAFGNIPANSPNPISTSSGTSYTIPSFSITAANISTLGGCGSYGLVKFQVVTNLNALNITPKVIHISSTDFPTVINSIPGAPLYKNICNSGNTGGTFCLNTGSGDIVNWVSGPSVQGWSYNDNCVTVGPSATNTPDYYTINVTNSCGNTQDLTVAITTYDPDPAYSLSWTNVTATQFGLTGTPANSNLAPAQTVHIWEICEVSLSVNNVYVENLATKATITQPNVPSSGPLPTNFCGYNQPGVNLPGPINWHTIVGCTLGPGLFDKTKKYRIRHIVDCPSCVVTDNKNVVNQYVTICANCREHKNPGKADHYFVESFLVGNETITREETGATGIQPNAPAYAPFDVYPNPGTGLFEIKLFGARKGTLDVFDVLGKKVKSISLGEQSFTYSLDLTGYTPGVYTVRVNAGADTFNKKIVLE